MARRIVLAAVLYLLGTGLCSAEVVDSSSVGFTVKATFNIQAIPEEVYRKLLDIGQWWDSMHTFSRDAHNLSIEAKAAGCFCEKLPNGGGVRHMEVLYIVPGKTLRMGGGLGPLQAIASTASMTIGLSPAQGGTKLELTYIVAGYLPAGMNTLAAPVDSVLTAQFNRLKNFVERGDPVKAPEQK
jgi:uncharacterized protein YndB with AHSA1/START domain